MTEIKLKAGRDYLTRGGQTVRILSTDVTSTACPGCSAVGRLQTSEIVFYFEDGICQHDKVPMRDIVSEKKRGVPACLDIQLRRGGAYMTRGGSLVRVVTDALSGEGHFAEGLYIGLIRDTKPVLFYADGKIKGLNNHEDEISYDLSDANEDDLFVWFDCEDHGPFIAKAPPLDLIRAGSVDVRDVRVIQCFEDLPSILPLDFTEQKEG